MLLFLLASDKKPDNYPARTGFILVYAVDFNGVAPDLKVVFQAERTLLLLGRGITDPVRENHKCLQVGCA